MRVGKAAQDLLKSLVVRFKEATGLGAQRRGKRKKSGHAKSGSKRRQPAAAMASTKKRAPRSSKAATPATPPSET